MLIDRFQRGDGFVFTAAPTDVNNNPVTPDSATLYINFLNTAGEREDADPIAMDGDTAGETFTAEWTSRGIGAAAGRVHWCIRTVNPDSAEDGFFELDANLANPAD